MSAKIFPDLWTWSRWSSRWGSWRRRWRRGWDGWRWSGTGSRWAAPATCRTWDRDPSEEIFLDFYLASVQQWCEKNIFINIITIVAQERVTWWSPRWAPTRAPWSPPCTWTLIMWHVDTNNVTRGQWYQDIKISLCSELWIPLSQNSFIKIQWNWFK